MNIRKLFKTGITLGVGLLMLCVWSLPGVFAAPLPGGTLDPTTVPKYVTPLVIPPVMNNDGAANSYDMAVRQFQQQILPGGIWNTLNGRHDMQQNPYMDCGRNERSMNRPNKGRKES